jgi:hypothetical protein
LNDDSIVDAHSETQQGGESNYFHALKISEFIPSIVDREPNRSQIDTVDDD